MIKQSDKDIHRIPPQMCPNCGHILDAVGGNGEDDEPPEAGSYTVCFGCTVILRFDANMRFVALSLDAIKTLQTDDPELFAELRSIAEKIILIHVVEELKFKGGPIHGLRKPQGPVN